MDFVKEFSVQKLLTTHVNDRLLHIPSPPEYVYVRGRVPPRDTKCLAVVGSRKYTNYAKQVTEHLIGGLHGYPICIISGLAIGVDTLAHTTALENHLTSVAVPGSGLNDDVLYPTRNKSLAHAILNAGGALISEFEPTFTATPWSFPQRNRLMAGMSDAVLLIEAGEKSGTLITARLAADYNREVLVVPGNIFSENSKGVHQFLKLGATPVTSPDDIISILGLTPTDTTPLFEHSYTEEEFAVISLLTTPTDSNSLIQQLPYPPHESLTLLMKMSLRGTIREDNGLFYKI
ncbi:MAG TPA: DNA-processing protein DprA [Candidatus Paceibacterota bacterium]|nr:DNA-processing protein DprA [Candidatus Paceibacterota bacterium]